jgi:hypothetical protein
MQFTRNAALMLSWWIPLNWGLYTVLECKTSIFDRLDDLKLKTRLIGKMPAKSSLQNVEYEVAG